MGMAAGVLRAAGSIFGGALGRAGWAGDQVKDVFRGKAWDDAFARAVEEGQQKFKQCTRCGKWVCPEVCWNEKRSLCVRAGPPRGGGLGPGPGGGWSRCARRHAR
jgi:hypothetical protein